MGIKFFGDLKGNSPPGTHTTIVIGGDPTLNCQIQRFNVVLTKEQWDSFIERFGHLKDLHFGNASFREVPNLLCSCCSAQLPHDVWLEQLLTYTHIYSSIKVYGHTDEGNGYLFRFFLCGTSERHGCIHKILEDLKIPY